MPISLFTLVLLVNRPKSENVSISVEADFPLESSLMRMEAERVYTGGVVSRYQTAMPRQTANETTNQCHFPRQR